MSCNRPKLRCDAPVGRAHALATLESAGLALAVVVVHVVVVVDVVGQVRTRCRDDAII